MDKAILSLAVLLFSLSSTEARPLVFVPAPPYQFLVERIAGDLVEVRSICGPTDDPHDYTPTPRQLVEMTGANLLFSGGLGFESNFFIKLGDEKDAPRQVSLLEGLTLLEGQCDHPSHHTESEADDTGHSHERVVDPHVWLSPRMLEIQAGYVANSIKSLLPAGAVGVIEANLNAF